MTSPFFMFEEDNKKKIKVIIGRWDNGLGVRYVCFAMLSKSCV